MFRFVVLENSCTIRIEFSQPIENLAEAQQVVRPNFYQSLKRNLTNLLQADSKMGLLMELQVDILSINLITTILNSRPTGVSKPQRKMSLATSLHFLASSLPKQLEILENGGLLAPVQGNPVSVKVKPTPKRIPLKLTDTPQPSRKVCEDPIKKFALKAGNSLSSNISLEKTEKPMLAQGDNLTVESGSVFPISEGLKVHEEHEGNTGLKRKQTDEKLSKTDKKQKIGINDAPVLAEPMGMKSSNADKTQTNEIDAPDLAWSCQVYWKVLCQTC